MLEGMYLLEIDLRGKKCTWRRQNSRSRIDRAFMDSSWSIKFPNSTVVCDSCKFLNHNPIIIQTTDEEDWGRKPFRLYDM